MGLLEGLLERRTPQKAAIGRGADMLTYSIPLQSTLQDPTSMAAQALAAYRWSPYIRSAERSIKGVLSTLDWWLEDPEGERVTDESAENLRTVRDLLETPYTPKPGEPEAASPRTWAGITELTWRHMGCAGAGYWYLDQTDTYGLPAQIIYISPARMTPAAPNGQLIGWVMDYRKPTQVRFELGEIIPFYLEQPDEGFIPTGLVQTAMAKAELARRADQHAAYILDSGGRRPGIYHPPAGGALPDEVYEQLKRDLRSIVDMPGSAKRSMILKGPVEFDPTDSTVSDMKLLDIMNMTRDDIFGLWGTPKSQVGYGALGGIGQTSEDKDFEAMWNNAAQPRLMPFWETLQTRLLDRYQAVGIDLTLKFDTPTFDDDAPLYDMAQKAAGVPMLTSERRAILRLEPFGDERDEVMWMPDSLVAVQADKGIGRETVESIGTLIRSGYVPGAAEAALGVNPIPHTGAVPVTLQTEDRASAFGKARMPTVAQVEIAVGKFLREQARRIGKSLEANSAHLTRKPKDTATWWNEKEEDAALMAVLRPFIEAASEAAAVSAARKVPAGKATLDPKALQGIGASTIRRLASRVRGINRTTRDRIRDLTVDAIDVGMSPAELGRILRGEVPPLEGDRAAWEPVVRGADATFASELRGETIARTEMRVAQNAAQIDSFTALGSTSVEMLDGDQDAACAARNGQIVSMEAAEAHMLAEHPNGTLTFAPYVGDLEGIGKASIIEPVQMVEKVEPVNIKVAPADVILDTAPFAEAVGKAMLDGLTAFEARHQASMQALAQQQADYLAAMAQTNARMLDAARSLPVPIVNVKASEVVMPEVVVPAPVVNVTTPDSIRIESMPTRTTRRKVVARDRAGSIEETMDLESDA